MFLVLGYLALQYLRDPASVTPATKSTASRARNLVYFQVCPYPALSWIYIDIR